MDKLLSIPVMDSFDQFLVVHIKFLNFFFNLSLSFKGIKSTYKIIASFDPYTPPQIIWITYGNTSNAALKEILSKNLHNALRLLESGEPLVAISDPW